MGNAAHALWEGAESSSQPFGITSSSCSVAKLCPTLCDPVNCSTLGFPVLRYLLEFAQTLMSVESVMPSNHLILCCPCFSCPLSFPASGSFPMSRLFTSDGHSIGD